MVRFSAGSAGTYHFVSTSDEDRARVRLLALFDAQHVIAGGAEVELADVSCEAELLRRELLKAGNDATAGGDGDHFDFRSADPTYGGQFVREQHVVRLIVETPLADDQVRA